MFAFGHLCQVGEQQNPPVRWVTHLLTRADPMVQDSEQQLVPGDTLGKGGLSPGSGLTALSRVRSRGGLFAAGGDEGKKISPFPRWPEGAGAAGILRHGRNDSVGASHRSNHKDQLSVENLSCEGIKAAPCVPKRRGRRRKRGQRAAVLG